MKSTVTPGFWQIVPFTAIDKRICIAADKSRLPLAWVDNDDTMDGPANARLIAAAPRMLDTLQWIAKEDPNWTAFLQDIITEANLKSGV